MCFTNYMGCYGIGIALVILKKTRELQYGFHIASRHCNQKI